MRVFTGKIGRWPPSTTREPGRQRGLQSGTPNRRCAPSYRCPRGRNLNHGQRMTEGWIQSY